MARARKSDRSSGKSKSKGSTVSVNFKGVQSRQLLPEDDYRAKLVEAEQGESGNGNDQITWKFAVNNGSKFDGQKLYFHTPLTENSLWKLHALLTAFGIEVPDDELDLDLEELVEAEHEIMAVVQHETYDGTKRSKMMDFYAIEADEDGDKGADDKEEKSSKGKKDDKKSDKGKKDSKKKEPEKIAESKVEEMDREELEELIKEHKLDVDADEIKRLPKLQAAVIEALKEEGLLEDSDDADEGYTSDQITDMDEEGLEGVIKEHELDVDLDDYKTLRKKAGAVIDALESAGKLKED